MKSRLLTSIFLALLLVNGSGIWAQTSVGESRNQVRNGGFDSPGPEGIAGVKGSEAWGFTLNGGGAGGQATARLDNGALRVGDISDPGKMVYAIQLIQAKMNLVKGVRYRLQFDAKAESPRSIKVKLGGLQSRDWADYTKIGGGGGDGVEFALGTTMKTYSHEFQMSQPSDPAARFEFQLGLQSVALWIDNVSLEPLVAADGLVRTGSLQNGDFSQEMKYWDLVPPAAVSGSASAKVGAGELAVALPALPANAAAVELHQTGLVFEKGKSYQLAFYARAEKSRSITVLVGNRRGPQEIDPIGSQAFQLGAANQPYNFSFTVKDDLTLGGTGELVFTLGGGAETGAANLVSLSKISVLELDKPVIEFVPLTASELIKNGNFEMDSGNWTGLSGTRLSIDNSRLKLAFPPTRATAKPAAAFTDGLKLAAGGRYLLSFVYAGDAERKLVVSLKGKKGAEYLDSRNANLSANGKEGYFQYYFEVSASDEAALSFSTQPASDAAKNVSNPVFWIDHVSLRASGPWMDSRKTPAERVSLLMAQMNLDEKVGQMVQSERAAAQSGDVRTYGIGSVLSGGGSVPSPNTPASWFRMFNRFQSEAMATRLAIPILYGIDAVHGHGNVSGATIFPHNIGLGATRNPGLLEKIGAVTALEVAATGLNWTFGPCVAVARDERWGRTYESFGESPELQNLLAGAFVQGLQGQTGAADWMSGRHVVGTAKHFLGDGGAEWRTGEGNYTIDRGDIKTLSLDQLKAIHAPGYIQAIKAGVGTVMASFNLFKGIHMSVNKDLLTGYLKAPVANGGLGFEGFVIGDWDAFSLVHEIGGDYATKVLAAFNAGMDMSMEQSKWFQVIRILKDGAQSGAISQARIDDAVRRILTVKFQSGVFDRPWALDVFADKLGSAENRAVAAQAVRESLVLLKNEKNLLPLKKSAKIFVGGPIADNIGLQSGGWTIQWQGGSDRNGQRLTAGSTILEGMKAIAKANGGEIVTDISKAGGCELAVVVVGESPYAEGVGDVGLNGGLTLEEGKVASGNLAAIKAAQALKIPVLVIVVSGRPLIITKELPTWNALVAAWLPGSEGAAVADVLYGLVNFKGVLPITWPKSLEQLPINVGDPDYDKKGPLFPYGFGLQMKLQ